MRNAGIQRVSKERNEKGYLRDHPTVARHTSHIRNNAHSHTHTTPPIPSIVTTPTTINSPAKLTGLPLALAPPLCLLCSSIYVTLSNCPLAASRDTLPLLASARSCSPNVTRIFVDLPAGQNTTSQPPPLGMMNVLVWSSNAKEYASGHTAFALDENSPPLHLLGSFQSPEQQSSGRFHFAHALKQGSKAGRVMASSGYG